MRTRLYHDDCPEGKVFFDQQEHDKALNQGWQEAPWMVKQENSINKGKVIPNYVTEMPNPKDAEMKPCECGCGTLVKRRFAHGHYKPKRKANDHHQNSQPPGKEHPL